ncbi:hypothetical protein [Streptomyces sp. 35G-GA-8]|uniref:hypothetical protein n=1 Tax=Streptomyces sp. 35G-GA-8 TaxID=2939434 RepID=UPI00201F2344|nr:hypothetical protein [Streptomyces sp. 35G-GA-8]MCL7382591.1 hypothetical protein [Streptomyces sp. 35G-GA-8]
MHLRTSRVAKVLGAAAAVAALTMGAASQASAASVTAAGPDGFYNGSVVVNATNVKINGRVTDDGNYSGQSAVYLKITSSSGGTRNYEVSISPNADYQTFSTKTYPFSGSFRSGYVTVCSGTPNGWQCGTPRAL